MYRQVAFAVLFVTVCSVGAARCRHCVVSDKDLPGLRTYYDYPYTCSWGPRYDPYWSYKSSYFPEQYGGDGSYYGLGYSGTAGDGWYGTYWYW